MAKSSKGASGPARTGGGVGSAQHNKTPIKAGGPVTKRISVESVAGQGIKRGNKAMDNKGGPTAKAMRPPLVSGMVPQVRSGNATALDMAGSKAGPGAGRNINPTGSQGQHGRVAGSVQPQGRDILSEFSPSGGKR
jgi:hypothetical protein